MSSKRKKSFATAVMAVLYLMLLATFFVVLAGCTYVKPADRVVIHENYMNYKAMNAKVQEAPVSADPNVPLPQWAKDYWALAERDWYALDQWANRKRATPHAVRGTVANE